MARRKEQASRTRPTVGKAGPPVVNLSGQHQPGTQETARYPGPAQKSARTATHRRPVTADQAASNQLAGTALTGGSQQPTKHEAMRAAGGRCDAGAVSGRTIRFLTGTWVTK